MANHAAIEQQHGHLEPVLTGQLRIGVHIDDGDGRQTLMALEVGEPVEHVLAKPTALAAEHHEASRQLTHLRRGGVGASPIPWVAEDGAFGGVDFTCVAMN